MVRPSTASVACTETSAPDSGGLAAPSRDPISGSSGCATRQPSTRNEPKPAKPRSDGNCADRLRELRRGFAHHIGFAKRAHEAHPDALVGHCRAQREAFAGCGFTFDPHEARTAGEIGRRREINLLGAEKTRLALGRRDHGVERPRSGACKRAMRDRGGLCRRARSPPDRPWRAVWRTAPWHRSTSSLGPPSRRSSAMPAGSPSKSTTPTAAFFCSDAICCAALSPTRGLMQHVADTADALDPGFDAEASAPRPDTARPRAARPATPPTSTARSRRARTRRPAAYCWCR